MKKNFALRASASTLATSMMLAAGVAHADETPVATSVVTTSAQAVPVVVVDGAGNKGYVISDGIAKSGNNPTVINSNSGTVSLGSVGAISTGANVSIGSADVQTVFTNFYTTGGAGSGGGAGLGGVLFVDKERSLTLNNVSFISNVAKGGQGGAYQKAQVASTIVALNNIEMKVSEVAAFASAIDVAWNSGAYYITGITLPASNQLLASGATIAAKGNSATATIASVSGSTVNFANGGIRVDSSNIQSIDTVLFGADVLRRGQTVISFGAASTVSGSTMQEGSPVFGQGIAEGTTVSSITYTPSGKIASVTLSKPVEGVYWQDNNGPNGSLRSGYNNISGFQTLDLFDFQATAFKSVSPSSIQAVGIPISGVSAGMDVTVKRIDGSTFQTQVTDVASDGTISFADNVTGMASFTASSTGARAGSNVITLPSVTGLVAGMSVTGTGIPTGTTITAINGNKVTLSNALTGDVTAALENKSMFATFGNVLGINTAANTVTLGSVAGLRVGQIISGAMASGAAIPGDAVITNINASTGVVTYRVISGVSNLTTGGAMNGLAATNGSGSNGADGLDGGMWNTIMHDGEGESGLNGYNGGDGSTGQTGGKGGEGGSGTRALPYNTDLMLAVTTDAIDLATDLAEGASLSIPDPFPKPTAGGLKWANTVFKVVTLVRDSLDLATWQIYLGLGLVGRGGDGMSGGSGGNGATFLGGGEGGQGGAGGDSATSRADGGAGGDGGSGGAGGFGAGGGSGGKAGSSGWGGQASQGGNGDGGEAGFGAGAGASAGIGGDGGSGLGGSLFVRTGGTLTITGNALFRNNTVLAGSGGLRGAAGEAAGTDLFMMKDSNVTLAPGEGNIIRFEGSIADDSAASIGAANWASGEGANLTIVGGGLVQFAGENTYTGHTIIAGATLEAEDGLGIHNDSNIEFSGQGTVGQGSNFSNANAGVWLTMADEVVRRVGSEPAQISWTGSGGFAAGDNGLLLNFGSIGGGAGQTLVWNSGGFVPNNSTLMFGSAFGTGTVTLANNVNLNGLNGKIAVYNNVNAPSAFAVMAGQFGNGTLTVNDTNYSGALVFTAENSLSGLTLNHGLVTTALEDGEDRIAMGRLMNASSGGYLTITGDATVKLYSPEKLTAVNVASQGKLYAFSDVNSGNITNNGTIGFGGPTNTIGNIINNGDMSVAGTISAGSIQNTGGLALFGNAVATGAITNTGSQAQLSMAGSTSLTTGDVLNDAALLTLQSGAITTGNITNSNGGALWLIGQGVAQNGSILNNVSSSLYLAGDFQADGRVTNYGTMYIVGSLSGASESGATTRKLYTTGLWDPDGVFQLGGLNGNLANVFEVHQSGISNNSGVFTGAGSLVFTGGGLMNMTGASDFTGGFTITGGSSIDTTGGGTLANTLAITVADSASHLTLGTQDVIGSITNAGLVDANAAIGLTGGLTNTGTFNVNFVSADGSLAIAGNVANNGGTINLAAGTTSQLNSNLTNSGTITNAGGSLAVFGTVTNQAQGVLNVQAGSVDTFAALTNNGTVNMAADVTVTGALVQNAGAINAAAAGANLSAGSLSGAGGTIAIGGNTFTVNQTVNGSYAGSINGSGTVVKTGTATLTLAGAAGSFAPANLAIQQGAVAVNGAGILDSALSVGVSSGATLSLVTGNQTIRNLTGAGSLSLNGNNLYLAQGGNFAGTVTGSGNVQVTSGTFNLSNTINSTSGNFQVQSNSAMNVAPTGTLNAPTVSVTGALNVQGTVNSTTNTVTGVLHLGNSTGTAGGSLVSTTTNVNGGGLLSGVGSITGAVVIGGSTAGTLRPGNSPGAMAIANLVLDSNSTTVMEVEGNAGAGLSAAAGGYDQITVTGALTLRSGSVLQIANSNAYELGLGEKVKIFNFAPGSVSGSFGAVSKVGFDRNVAFNLATGSVVGLGTHTADSFEASVSSSANDAKMLSQLRMSKAGGVNQYYGGRLIEFAATALASGNSANVAAVFDKASPEGYVGLLDHMKLSMLDNRLELGGYEVPTASSVYVTGSINYAQARSRDVAGYARYKTVDRRGNLGVAADFPFARLQASYGHTDGHVEGTYMRGKAKGDQLHLGASAPVGADGALRLAARFGYGAYRFDGTRVTNAGVASFGKLHQLNGSSTVFGAGFEYLKTSDKLSVDFAAELLSVLNKIDGFVEAEVGKLETLAVHRQRDKFEMAGAKINLGYQFTPAVKGFLNLSVDHDLQDRMKEVSANVVVEAANMTVVSPGISRTRFDAGMGVRVNISDSVRWTIEGQLGNASRYGARTAISMRF